MGAPWLFVILGWVLMAPIVYPVSWIYFGIQDIIDSIANII